MKTRDAFALRELYHISTLQPSNMEESLKLSWKYEKFFEKGYEKPVSYENLDDIADNIEYCKFVVRRTEFLIRLVKNHLRRIGMLMSAIAVKLVDDSVDDSAKNKIRRLNFLIKAYSEILSGMIGQLDDSVISLQKHRQFYKKRMQELFGKRLRKARKRAGYTNADMAQFLELRPNSYTDYELGRATPPLCSIRSLAKKFNVTTDYLLCMD